MGFDIVATRGTAAFLAENDIPSKEINKVREGSPHIVDELLAGRIDIVVNTPEGTGPLLDSRSIRSTATQLSLPLFTTIAAAAAAVEGIAKSKQNIPLEVCSIQEYLSHL
jgi:carbamoyl-phosphate synthase large subunit